MECAQVTEEQRLWTETQKQKAKHNAWPSSLASVYLTNPPVAESRLKPLLKQLSPVRSTWSKEYGRRRFNAACIPIMSCCSLSDLNFDSEFRTMLPSAPGCSTRWSAVAGPKATATTESSVLDGARDRPSTLPKMLDTEDTNGLRTLARYSTTHTHSRYRY